MLVFPYEAAEKQTLEKCHKLVAKVDINLDKIVHKLYLCCKFAGKGCNLFSWVKFMTVFVKRQEPGLSFAIWQKMSECKFQNTILRKCHNETFSSVVVNCFSVHLCILGTLAYLQPGFSFWLMQMFHFRPGVWSDILIFRRWELLMQTRPDRPIWKGQIRQVQRCPRKVPHGSGLPSASSLRLRLLITSI